MVNADNARSLHLVGQGAMTWMFMDIYQASLYSADGRYQRQEYPQALKIHYKKSVSKTSLVDATNKQWQHLALSTARYQPWLNRLNSLWPDIKKGDNLLFYVTKNGQGIFYHNGKRLGGINSREFSDAFLGIWLSKQTSEPVLRRQLIGEYR